jgi:hypothetical protein
VTPLVRYRDRRQVLKAPTTRPLYSSVDHGHPIALPADVLLRGSRDGWGGLADRFQSLNRVALDALDVQLRLDSNLTGSRLHVLPGGRAGAVPLRSPITGEVAAGLLIKPRFGWSGVGQILQETGWHAAPDVLEMPVVPGSASEVPPWVLAGPVLSRLADLLRDLKRGYEFVDDTRAQPKGTIRWAEYASRHVPRGDLHHVPCRYPDLGIDPEIVRAVRWTLERLHTELARVGGRDRIATTLVQLALHLMEKVKHVRSERPRPETLHQILLTNPYLADAIRRGLQAIGWIVEERGLGGTDTSNGLAWSLPLEVLWEHYVESHYRSESRMTGATIRVGRLGETTFPIRWRRSLQRSLSQLVPDLVLQRGREIHVVDAKYKAHFTDLDERGWREFQDDERSAHRSDVHQVLAYAGLFDGERVTATLVYPLRRETYLALAERGHDRATATLYHGNREVSLELRGLPFGSGV